MGQETVSPLQFFAMAYRSPKTTSIFRREIIEHGNSFHLQSVTLIFSISTWLLTAPELQKTRISFSAVMRSIEAPNTLNKIITCPKSQLYSFFFNQVLIDLKIQTWRQKVKKEMIDEREKGSNSRLEDILIATYLIISDCSVSNGCFKER